MNTAEDQIQINANNYTLVSFIFALTMVTIVIVFVMYIIQGIFSAPTAQTKGIELMSHYGEEMRTYYKQHGTYQSNSGEFCGVPIRSHSDFTMVCVTTNSDSFAARGTLQGQSEQVVFSIDPRGVVDVEHSALTR